MQVTAPIVSEACSLRTRLFDLSIRRMLRASARVMAIGRPSGTAMTISVTANMKYFSTTSVMPSQSFVCHNSLVSMSCPKNSKKLAVAIPPPTLLMSFASRSS